MNKLGTLLIYIGTITGLTAAARIPPHFIYFWSSVGILIIGILLKNIRGRSGSRVSNAMSVEELRGHLLNAFREVQTLTAAREVMNIKAFHDRIDRIINEHLFHFGHNASTMKSMFGISGYNSVMVHYALGERYINRVWSASADGYPEEAFDYLEKAEPEFKDALEMIDTLHAEQKL